MHEIELVCDEVTIINQGKILASGSLEEIKALTVNQVDLMELHYLGNKELLEKTLNSLSFLSDLIIEESKCSFAITRSEENSKELYRSIKKIDIDLIELKKGKVNLENSFLSLLQGAK